MSKQDNIGKTVRELSEAIGMDRGNLFKLLKKLNINTFTKRSSLANNQPCAHVTLADFDAVVAFREDFSNASINK